ncbi:MAG: mobile mystery protein A [Candidatus Omnitrophota bacterium]
MAYWDMRLIRRQVQEKIAVLKKFSDMGMPEKGWIKTIRESLGMTTGEMAGKTGLDQSRISRLEKAEPSGRLTVSSLQKIAKGLGMRFVYGFVGEKTLEQMVRDQAQKIARKRMKRLDNTMALEEQGLSDTDKQAALKDMVDKIMMERPKDFWNDTKI